MNSIFCFVCFYAIAHVHLVSGLSRPSTIVFENNGFTNVVIAIHESVGEDKALLDTLKNEMTKASKILHVATEQRAYFKEIKILLPSTWSNDASYQTPTTENLAFADVIVTDPIKGKRSLPQTRSYDGCGKQGIHVLLTKEFLTVPRKDPYFGNPAKFFIHAFAQFRWGVFQEYAEEGENVFYMSPSTGQPEAIRCTFGIRGLIQKTDAAHTICYSHLLADRNPQIHASIDEKTGLYESDCQWRPYPNHQRTKASIMDHQFIAELETFCKDDPSDYSTLHNYEAPSKHNRLCGHKSTWAVITETDDFRAGINPAKTLSDAQLTPTFIVMRATSRKRRAVVLTDPSFVNEIPQSRKIQQVLRQLQHELSTTDTELHFETGVGKQLQQTPHSIGNGAMLGERNLSQYNDVFGNRISEVLEKYRTVDDNDIHLVVITENVTGNFAHDLTDRKQNRLKVSFLSNSVTNIINDHHEAFAVHNMGEVHGHTLLDRLRHVLWIDPTNTVIVAQEEWELSDSEPVTGRVDIDRTLGNRVSFIFHFENDLPDIAITSPLDVVYGTGSSVYSADNDSKVIQFNFNFSEAGTWKYTMSQSSMTSEKIRVTIISEENVLNEDPVVLRKSVKFADDTNSSLLLHVDATQGLYPLLGFNVTAKIETPKGNIESLTLLDNGAGADISKDDGIYSRIYIAPKLSGSYHVTFIVTAISGTAVRREETVMVGNNEHNPLKKDVKKVSLDGNIQRQISGGTVFLDHSKECDVIHDFIAPSRITDLEAFTYILYRNTIVLKWTAPGDDHDHGRAAFYELFVGCGIKDVRRFLQYLSSGMYESRGDIARETFAADANGTESEMLLWKMKDPTKTCIFALRAFDEFGNGGQFSNIATAGSTSLWRK
ncbi:calcium-activated chloride channel regulator 1-like [Mercenaria mercenaria]|uniref:calcium-activated chloride channel regulator 1-like n=1 Tax=Mercenaria mercenaria TaxID=6596 RepID=UPI00234E47CF|nr:calcium-activated chloride channel regulator 1-like [Mercenaria mercenaria]